MENNTATNATPSTAGTADTQSGGLKERARQGARSLLDQTESEARSRIDAGKHRAAETLSSVASSLLNSSGQLKEGQQNLAGDYVEKAAEQIDRLAQYIQNADPAEVIDSVQQLARRRPALFIGSAFAVGVIAARFFRSSQRDVQRLSAPGITDREVPTLRSVESGAAGEGMSARPVGGGGLSVDEQ